MRKLALVFGGAIAVSAIGLTGGHHPVHAAPAITSVAPNPVSGCGDEVVVVQGSGFGGEQTPAFAFSGIATSVEDFEPLHYIELSDTEAVFQSFGGEPLTPGQRTFVLADEQRNVLAAAPITVTECPFDKPGAPGTPTVVLGSSGVAQVSWAAPADDGGDPIIEYAVVPFADGRDEYRVSDLVFVSGSRRSTIVSGLRPGVGYRFGVFAYNYYFESDLSELSTRVEPLGDRGADFLALTPARVLDTRPGGATIDGYDAGEGRVESGAFVHVAGRGGVPKDADAVVLNVTVVDPTAAGFVTVNDCSSGPDTSSLNFDAGQAVANTVVTALSDYTGSVCVSTSTPTEVIIDVNGAFRVGSVFDGVTPWRLLDTRSQGGVRPADSVIELQVAGVGDVPADATAVVMNVTAVEPEDSGFLTVYPCAAGRPDTSNVNYTAGQTVPNAVLATLDADGKVCIYTFAPTQLLADVNGVFPSGAELTSLTPARLFDSRIPGATVDGVQTGVGRLSAGSTTTVDVAGRGGVPVDASAAVLSVTAVNPGAPGFLTVFPCDESQPDASNVNYSTGGVVPNAVVAKLSGDGTVCVYTFADTELLVDVTAALP